MPTRDDTPIRRTPTELERAATLRRLSKPPAPQLTDPRMRA
ncbi:hypothetical protein ACVCAH_35790 [Micromonospora sp. LZ34]